MDVIEVLWRHEDESFVVVQRKSGLKSVIFIEASKSMPVDYASARPSIHQFLKASWARDWAKLKVAELRKSSKIEKAD